MHCRHACVHFLNFFYRAGVDSGDSDFIKEWLVLEKCFSVIKQLFFIFIIFILFRIRWIDIDVYVMISVGTNNSHKNTVVKLPLHLLQDRVLAG